MTKRVNRRISIGLAWYRENEWQDLRSFCEDRDNLEEGYHEWKRGAEKALLDLRGKGVMAETVDFDLTQFKAWCQLQHKRPNGASRTEFITLIMSERNQ